MPHRVPTKSLSVFFLWIASCASADPPTDAAITSALRHYEAAREALDEQGTSSPMAYDDLKSHALGDLAIREMTPHQIGLIYKARLLLIDDRREHALERLKEFAADDSVDGAGAAVLRLELLGSPFHFMYRGKRYVYRPDPVAARELLPVALNHPALVEAIRQEHAGASLVLSTIAGLRRPDLWQRNRSAILRFVDLFDDRAPVQFLLDAEYYLEVLSQIALESEFDDYRKDIARGSLALIRSRFAPQKPALAFLEAERCLEVLKDLVEPQADTVQQARRLIVQNGRQAFARDTQNLLAHERRALQGVFDRLEGAAGRDELIGHAAPPLDFIWSTQEDLKSLDDLEGKVVVLDFWATTCGPCVASFPSVRQLRDTYDGFLVEIVGVTSLQGTHAGSGGRVDCRDNPRREFSLMSAYVRERDITWTVAFSQQNVYNAEYGIRGIPHVVILDPAGRVRFRNLHPAGPLSEKVEKINSLLREFGLPAPDVDVKPAVVETDVMVPMRDGTRLACDIYRSRAQATFPVVLIRTPYDKAGQEWLARSFVERGYATVVQDVRGQNASEAEVRPCVNERADGLDTLTWIQNQPWCDGNIGMWGSSYVGFCAIILASEGHPGLKAVFQTSGWGNSHEVFAPGGAIHLMFDLTWALGRQIHGSGSFWDYDWAATFAQRPVARIPAAIGVDSPVWTRMMEDWVGPQLAAEGTVTREHHEAVPTFHMTGWNDFCARHTLAEFIRTQEPDVNDRHRLVVGPWLHDQHFTIQTQVANEEYGLQAIMGADRLIELSVEWFDRWLKGQAPEAPLPKPVYVFVMGSNRWESFDAWPPDEVQFQEWYLASDQGANSDDGDGSLMQLRPARAGHDTYTFDPDDPVPTTGGVNFHHFINNTGPLDQSIVEKRDDVLVYTSEPMASSVDIVGPLQVILYASTDARQTDFTAKLVDIAPSGYARIIEDGIRRGPDLDAREWADSVQRVARYTIDMGATAYTIQPGHRLRIEVSSSNFPKYTLNPNTGEIAEHAVIFKPARQTVYHGPQRSSRLLVPVLARPVESDK
jgi:putative CocE/NonD family hydrolase